MAIWTTSLGKLCNLRKHFLKNLGADAIRSVNGLLDADGISYAREAMSRTGMVINRIGQWEERQLFSGLQRIIAKFRNHFEGDVLPVYE